MIELGSFVRDCVTGFRGCVVVRAEWLGGDVYYEVQPTVDKDGKMPLRVAFREGALEVLEDEVVRILPLRP